MFGDSGYHLMYPDQDDFEDRYSEEQYLESEWQDWLEDKRPEDEYEARPFSISPVTGGVVPATGMGAISEAMRLVRADLAERGGGRSVVLAHTFVAGAEGESCESERAIVDTLAVGGVDRVPVSAFDGVTYAALGHVHGRSVLAEHVRYSGAPLHLSFSEEAKPRGGWLVELDESGLTDVTWVDLTVPRALVTLTGTLQELLDAPEHEAHTSAWVRAHLTDPLRQRDAMRRLQSRFPHCAQLDYVALAAPVGGDRAYRELVHGKSDLEVVDTFLGRVRGTGLDPDERAIVDDVLAHAGHEVS